MLANNHKEKSIPLTESIIFSQETSISRFALPGSRKNYSALSKSLGTCEGSINGNSSEAVSQGEKTFKRDVGIQASVSIVKGKYDDADDSDNENVQKEKANAQEGSVMQRSRKFKKIEYDTPDAEVSSDSKMRKKLRKLKKSMKETSDEEEVKRSKKRKEATRDTSDNEEEFKEFNRLENKRKKKSMVAMLRKREVKQVDPDVKTDAEAKGKSQVKNVKSSGGYFGEPTFHRG